MMRKPYFATLTMIVVLAMLSFACTSPRHRAVLDSADSLMNAWPDSALTLLNALLPDTNQMRKGDLMRFHLLRTNAENKCDTVLTARHAALMRRVCDYYDHRSSKREANDRMLAHYLLGRCYDDMGEAPAALQEFHNAADAADTTSTNCDFHQLSIVYSQASGIFNKFYMPKEELRELQQAARYALTDRDSLSYVIYEELSANCYAHLQEPDSFIMLKERCARQFNEMGYSNYAAIALGTTVHTLLERGDLDKAKEYLKYYESYSGLFYEDGSIAKGRETYYYCKGICFLQENKLDSAEYFFRKELVSGKTYNDQICAAQGLCKLYQRKQRNDSVAKYAQYSYAMNDSSYMESVSMSLHRMASMHNYTRYQRTALEQSIKAQKANRRMTILGLVILVAVVLLVYIVKRHRKEIICKEIELNQALLEYAKDKESIYEEKEELNSLLEAEKKMRSDMEHSLQDIIQGKNDRIEMLSKKIEDYETFYSRTTHDDQGIKEITQSSVYEVFDQYAANRKSKPTIEHWKQLQMVVEQHYPEFMRLLKVKNRVSTYDYRVCMLIVLRFTPGDMASIMEKELSSISKTRKKLLKNIFHMDGKPEDFDRLLRESL